MKETLDVLGEIATVYWLMSFALHNFLPIRTEEIIFSIKNGTVHAWRIFHPLLILIWYYEPQIWWKVLIMLLTVELSVIIATPIANWTCKKLGY